MNKTIHMVDMMKQIIKADVFKLTHMKKRVYKPSSYNHDAAQGSSMKLKYIS